MSINIPSKILTLKGQRVNQVQFDEGHKKLIIRCKRDKRRAAIDPLTGQKGRINRSIKRQVRDAPVFGQSCLIEIELAQAPSEVGEAMTDGLQVYHNPNAL
jgi:hypothetical protein